MGQFYIGGLKKFLSVTRESTEPGGFILIETIGISGCQVL